MKKMLSALIALVMALSLCGFAAAEDAGNVYYLNFKPEQAAQWEALAKVYTEQTGVPVTVVTAASGTYEDTCKAELAKDEAPTLFQVNGPIGLQNFKDYCMDLSKSDVYGKLSSNDFALVEGEAVYGIAYVVETYGIIYNKNILNAYFALEGAKAASMDEINNFAAFKAVVEDMQARKDELGILGAFTSAGMDSSSDWRFKTHLANLPVYYEYKDLGIGATDAIQGLYLDNYKAIWDLYINNATCEPTLLGAKTGDDAVSEFALGEAAFYQNGTWAYGDILKNGELTADDISMMPIYIGAAGEENQGLCTGSENYWCVNGKASQADIDATLAFLDWVVSSDEGRTALAKEMGFVCPFTTFTDEYVADNCLIKAANEYIAAGKTAVAWCFTTMPSETWKNGVGDALLEYAQGTGDWNAVVTAFVDGWASEIALAKK